MKKRQHTPEQIIRKLPRREAPRRGEVDRRGGPAPGDHRVDLASWHRWRNQYGGMKADDAKELRELRKENQRLKKIVADQALDIGMLKELNRGNH